MAPELTAQLGAAIAADLELSEPPELAVHSLVEADRSLYRIEVTGQTRWYILKQRTARAVKREDARDDASAREYQQLQAAWAFARQLPTGLEISAPVALFPEQQALLMRGCGGQEGDALVRSGLWRWRLAPQPLLSACAAAGRWLGHYHAAQTQQAGHWPTLRANRRQHVQRMLARIETTQPDLARRLDAAAVLARFDALTADDQVATGLIHGNFALRNLLIGNNSLAAIDFEDARVDALAADLGQLVAELHYKQVLPGFSAGVGRLARQALLDGYREAARVDPAQLAAWTGYHLLVHLYEHATRRRQRLPQRWLTRLRMQALTRWLADWSRETAPESPRPAQTTCAMEA